MICSITSLYVVYFSYRFLFLDKFHGFVCITHRYFNDITTFRQIGYIYRGSSVTLTNLPVKSYMAMVAFSSIPLT